MCIALSSLPALAKDKLRAGLVEVRQGFELAQIEWRFIFCLLDFGIPHARLKLLREAKDDRPDRHSYDERFPVAAMFVLAFSVRSSIRPHVWLIVETHKIVGVNVGLEDDAASVAAIAAVRTATRDEFLTAEATATIPAITGLRVDANVIDEFHSAINPQEREGSKFSGAAREPLPVTSS
jgi:hypothetical protein